LVGGVYLDEGYDEFHVDAVMTMARRLFPNICIHRLRMEPMITVAHTSSKKAQEQECAEFIVRELERMAA